MAEMTDPFTHPRATAADYLAAAAAYEARAVEYEGRTGEEDGIWYGRMAEQCRQAAVRARRQAQERVADGA